MEKTYSVLIQFGDGKPVTTKIRARGGGTAQDKAKLLYPAARSIRITGVLQVHTPKPKPQAAPPPVPYERLPSHLFTDLTNGGVSYYLQRSTQEEKLAVCHELRRQGLSYRAIAKQLDLPETTTRNWIKSTMPSA